MKIGSLFDGSGGFPLAASLCGIEPAWASEIEPYPIAVTRSRFPNMKHLGSITDIKGDEVEPVDIISFGSPCQDLSVAGKRAGLKHTENGDEETTRSGLFMEAIRIIKEMRKATNGEYPRYAIWENVPGAFSSNKGDDFRVVLEELIRIAEPTAVMPEVPKAGWAYSDVYCGDGWSLAYRVLDAQYWGVPQRRRRIYLVADFRGQRAGKISFEREGLRGYFTQGGTQGKAVAGDAEGRIGAADFAGGAGSDLIAVATQQGGAEVSTNGVCPTVTAAAGMSGNNQPWVTYALDQQGGKGGANFAEEVAVAYAEGFDMYNQSSTGEVSRTLKTPVGGDDHPVVCYSIEKHPADSRVNLDESGKVQTLTSRMGTGGGNVPMVMESVVYRKGTRPHCADEAQKWEEADTANTLNTFDQGEARANELVVETSTEVSYWDGGQTAGTLTANNAGGSQRMPDKDNFNCVISIDRAFFNQGQNAQYDPQLYEDGTNPTLVARGPNAVAVRYIVRRLTPTECARLQGFPDKWGHPGTKNELTDEEYAFWLDVRNTQAEINGKAVKDYTKDQMLTWYNKLHTDSSEYKMWGNGIALPCALYVMQGIAEVPNEN